jgi:hypothetical protein
MNSLSYKLGLTNDSNFEYKKTRDLHYRTNQLALCRQKYPGYIFVVVEPHKSFLRSDGEGARLKLPSGYIIEITASVMLIFHYDLIVSLRNTINANLTIPIKSMDSIILFSNNNILFLSKHSSI